MSTFSKFKITKFIWLSIGSIFLSGAVYGLISKYQIPYTAMIFASTYCFTQGSTTVNQIVNTFYTNSIIEHLLKFTEQIKLSIHRINKLLLQISVIGILIISSNTLISALICLVIIVSFQFSAYNL